mmetsp:Transcript_9737/g.19037  ORF Transcript_9737/g.19037 Transcript_9737/m.19037 type:complete len:108 (-) Transcript_9737:33-356(-)
MGRVLTFIGIVLLLHCVVSVIELRQHHKDALQLQEFVLPKDIIAETIIAALLAVYGYLPTRKDLKKIKLQDQMIDKTYDEGEVRPGFITLLNSKSKLAKVSVPPPPS